MFDKIVLAMDGSKHSERAAEVAAGLAKNLGSEVLILEVLEQLPTGVGVIDMRPQDPGPDPIEALAGTLKEKGINARLESQRAPYGHVADRITYVAKQQGARLIIMGSRGLSDLGGLLLGSVTHKVLHLSSCPVLVVR